MKEIQIGKSTVGLDHPTYFVADIAANHDNNINRALELIEICAESGANAAKFQNFKASTIVSDYGFKALKALSSHQSDWKESVYETYDKAALSLEWTEQLKQKCDECGIDYFTAPYDLEIIDYLQKYVCAWKVGSGDITWIELIRKLSCAQKPLLIATGASTILDVRAAMQEAQKHTDKIVLMQCNTNYTASLDNFKYINLRVLENYKLEFPSAILGLSDHTPGHSTTLGAIALGARVIEKHFTDDNSRIGPDHKFSMDPKSWRSMVNKSRELENSLGSATKKVEYNEKETHVLQRRALRAASHLTAGTILTKQHVIPLRPCPAEGLDPTKLEDILGKLLSRDLCQGELIQGSDLT